tara:strand:- start:6459 stop:7508 length:1050 start_codon:yes stop_codon:yes gene_type:complete
MLLKRLKYNNIPELKLNYLQKSMKDIVASKLENSIYQYENVKCPVCEVDNKELIGEKDRYGLSYKTNLCVSCGLIYTSPRMTQLSYNEFYNTEYRKLYVGKETATDSFFYSQRIKGKKIYDYLKRNNLILKEESFILEIGCGAGGILSVFKERGHKVKGSDLGEEYIEYGKKFHGLDIEIGFLSNIKIDKKPDIIIYSHVLEHILDLKSELTSIKNIISENTIVYIEVPGVKEIHRNFESNILKYFQNAHTYHFSLETLTNLFSIMGFELICGNQFVQSAFKLTTNKTIINNDYNNVKSYLLKTEKNRILYSFTPLAIKLHAKKIILKTLDILKLRKIARKIKNHFNKL